MKQFRMAAIAAGVAAALVPASMALAQDKPVKMSVVAFLSGAAAGPFGVPSRNGAEVVIAAINDGKLPAPYNTKGLAGRSIEAEYIDESGGNTKQVAEYRNMVEKRGVDVALGYISSGTCAALTPVAEELKKLTVYAICGTPRIFEEAKRAVRVPHHEPRDLGQRRRGVLRQGALPEAQELHGDQPELRLGAGFLARLRSLDEPAHQGQGLGEAAVAEDLPGAVRRPRSRRCCSIRPSWCTPACGTATWRASSSRARRAACSRRRR